MNDLQPVGPHTLRMWEATAEIRRRIDDLPFLHELGQGTLEPEKFAFYIQQDTHYLIAYQKAMTALASRAPQPEDLRLWALAAAEAVVEEQQMHKNMANDPLLAKHLGAHTQAATARSLHTAAYSDFLVAAGHSAPYAVASAAVLPCFWIYADVSARLAETAAAANRDNGWQQHPYHTWISAYSHDDFRAVVSDAMTAVERACARAPETEREAAVEAFRASTRFEELFWMQAQDAPAARILV